MAPRKKDGTFPFQYTPSHLTNVAETIQRARDRIELAKKVLEQTNREPQKVQQLTARKERNG